MTDLIRRADVLKLLNDEADKCDDAARWGGSKQYVRACRDAAYAIRGRAAAIAKMPAALDEAEARAVKAEAERDAANALLREIETHLSKLSGFWFDVFPRKEIRAHLGAKP